METNADINFLLDRHLFEMKGHDLVTLWRYAAPTDLRIAPVPSPQAIGITALADALSCSASQIYNLKKAHMLDDAVVSHVGRRIVFDVEKARAAANNWQCARKNNKPAEVAG